MLPNYPRFAGPVPEEQVVKIMREYEAGCNNLSNGVKLADCRLSEPDEQSVATHVVTFLTLTQTRHRPTRMRGDDAPMVSTANVGAKYGILSDIPLADFIFLAKMTAACITQMRATGRPVYRNVTPLRYDCRVCAVGPAKDDAFLREDYNVWSGPRKAGVMRPGLYIRYVADWGQLGCRPVTRFGPSRTELPIDSFAKVGPPPSS